MASPIIINGAIIQYAFIDRVNTVSKKYSDTPKVEVKIYNVE